MHDTASPLRALYQRASKHSSYQQVHPWVAPLLGAAPDLPAGKLEAQRQRFFARHVDYAGARVLDIGANTGYFSFAAIEAGAADVQAYEGNPAHAEFVRSAAAQLGVADRLQVHARYFSFASSGARHDIGLCLNVLHHLGDDFGDRTLTIEQALRCMQDSLRAMADSVATLILQIGFNWKGDVRYPLFAGGEKTALVDFVLQGAAGAWSVAEIAVPDPATGAYEALSSRNLARNDAVGEFRNRPLFVLRSCR
jgi:SAM-dependent methyltransferase